VGLRQPKEELDEVELKVKDFIEAAEVRPMVTEVPLQAS
jgi:hypothetical protein